jgi:tyrosyl-tRNA synthetase
MQPDKAFSLLKQGAAQIISDAELQAKLELGIPLRVKLGVDPTSPDLHLGHAIILRKLRQFQDLGHKAILIIGDFTSMIGDPSGRSTTRPPLSRDEIMRNAQTYRTQAFKILDDDDEKIEVKFNAEWFEEIPFEKIIRLNSTVTLQQMLKREDFRNRFNQEQPIYAHEIQYPIMQGWDSVMVKADVELGGTDQLFNNLVGRDLQGLEGQPQQVVLVMPILEGLDGSMKMSKSLGNYIGLTEPASEMFGKLMSISDELMGRYYPLLLGKPLDPAAHPLEAKKHLAATIVETYHSREAAEKTLQDWNTRFSQKRLADADLPEITPNFLVMEELYGGDALSIVHGAYRYLKINKSRTEVRRLIEQGSVQVDGEKIRDSKAVLALQPGQILRLDKTHALRIA